MQQSIEARWLIHNWNKEILGKYQNQWIAVLGETIIANAESFKNISVLISDYRNKNDFLNQRTNPLFAFVYFGRLQ